MRGTHHVLAHAALGGGLAMVADAAPSEPRSDTTAATPSVVATVTPHGIWLSAGPGARCFVPREAGEIDVGAVEPELRRLRSGDRSSLVISAIRGVPYRDLVRMMDLGVKVGLTDTSLDGADAAFDDGAVARRTAPAHCPTPPAVKPVRQIAPKPAALPLRRLTRPPSEIEIARWKEEVQAQRPLPPPPPKPALSKAPVIVITKTEVTFQGRHLAAVSGLASGSGVIQPLLEQIDEARRRGDIENHPPAILQADESLDAIVILRACETARVAGYGDLLFAVQNATPSR